MKIKEFSEKETIHRRSMISVDVHSPSLFSNQIVEL